MFDSPFEYCGVCGQYVLLDQTQVQCAHEHACSGRVACPLAKYFTGFAFGAAVRASERPPHRMRKPPVGNGT